MVEVLQAQRLAEGSHPEKSRTSQLCAPMDKPGEKRGGDAPAETKSTELEVTCQVERPVSGGLHTVQQHTVRRNLLSHSIPEYNCGKTKSSDRSRAAASQPHHVRPIPRGRQPEGLFRTYGVALNHGYPCHLGLGDDGDRRERSAGKRGPQSTGWLPRLPSCNTRLAGSLRSKKTSMVLGV